MNDAISRSALMSATLERLTIGKRADGVLVLRETITAQELNTLLTAAPTLDVQPVVRAEWINTKERLPEEDETVLVYSDGVIGIARIYDKDINTREPIWTYTGTGCNPEYWMPLPEPPEEDACSEKRT